LYNHLETLCSGGGLRCDYLPKPLDIWQTFTRGTRSSIRRSALPEKHQQTEGVCAKAVYMDKASSMAG
jgi:hypothetical protein